MIKKIKDLYKKYEEVILYLIMGVLSMIVNFAVQFGLLFTVLDASDGFQLQLSVVIAWVAAVLFAYITNRIFVFKSKNNKLKEFVNFIIARIFTLGLEMLIIWFFITFLEFNSNFWVVVWKLFAQAVVIISNYIFSKLFIFKKDEKQK